MSTSEACAVVANSRRTTASAKKKQFFMQRPSDICVCIQKLVYTIITDGDVKYNYLILFFRSMYAGRPINTSMIRYIAGAVMTPVDLMRYVLTIGAVPQKNAKAVL